MASLVETLGRRLPDGVIRLNSPVSQIRRSEFGGLEAEFARSKATRSDSMRSSSRCLLLPRRDCSEMETTNWPRSLRRSSMPAVQSFALAIDATKSATYPLDSASWFQWSNAEKSWPQVLPARSSPHAPDDQIVVRVFVGGALQPQLIDRSTEELGQLAHEETGRAAANQLARPLD